MTPGPMYQLPCDPQKNSVQGKPQILTMTEPEQGKIWHPLQHH